VSRRYLFVARLAFVSAAALAGRACPVVALLARLAGVSSILALLAMCTGAALMLLRRLFVFALLAMARLAGSVVLALLFLTVLIV